MKDIQPYQINLAHSYVSMHKQEIQQFYYAFDKKISSNELKIRLLTRKSLRVQFNRWGGIVIPLSRVSKSDLNKLQQIEASYWGSPFFKKSKGILTNRGAVYYLSSVQEQPTMKQIRIIVALEISLDLLEKFIYEGQPLQSYALLSLIDDIRYKALLLYEQSLSENSASNDIEKIVEIFSPTYYRLISEGDDQKVEPFVNSLILGIKLFKRILNKLISRGNFDKSKLKLRTYNEADNPESVSMFITKMRHNLPQNIKTIIGIRFGGIELPYLLRSFCLPSATISLVKISSYSDQGVKLDLKPETIKRKNIILVDDNILTGRTVAKLLEAVKTRLPKNVYFSCISYSGMKRYPQMIMKDHGIVNPRVLESSCLINQSNYTRITNSRSYKNEKGVFDKTKYEIQRNLDSYNYLEYKV